MGTRGLVGFIIKGVRKGAYNHYDSYPAGLGNDIIRFILSLSEAQIVDMEAKVEAIEWIQSEEGTTNNHDLLERIQGGQSEVVDESDFAQDGLFCEYAYFIDFENRLVKVAKGFGGGEMTWTFADLSIDCFGRVDQADPSGRAFAAFLGISLPDQE